MENCCGAKPTKEQRKKTRLAATRKRLREMEEQERGQAGRQAVPEPELQPEPEENYPDSYTGHYGQGLRKLDEPPSPTQPEPTIISILIARGIIDQNKLDKIRNKYKNNKGKRRRREAAVYPFSSNVPGHSRDSSEREWGYMVEAYGNEINDIINGNATRYEKHFPYTNIDDGMTMFGNNFYKKLVEHWGIDLLKELGLEELIEGETGTAKLKYKKKTRKTRKKRKTRKTRKKRKKIKTKKKY